ncbi:MAG: hypothetical protein JWM28_3498 [Chitinophagaceae bacterium]|nr:hypothetical protein [Chitinophagaceae bacterium]
MIYCFRTQLPITVLAIFSIFIVATPSVAQIIPLNQDFESYSDNAITARRIAIVPGPPDVTYSFVAPAAITGSVYMSLGVPPGGLFRPGKAFTFNLGTAGAIPGAGQPGAADYRIHFTSSADTNTKIGNFAMQSMYLAIGAGNTENVFIQGFRAGRLSAIAFISLSSNSLISSNSPTDLSYNGTDAYSGTYISFGTNWQFLDGLRFVVSNTSIPLSIDDINFTDPTNYPPSTQASGVTFNNNTGFSSGINWTPGNGDSTIVFIDQTNTGAPVPSDYTYYTANTNFGTGSQIGSSGWYCVYKGIGNNVNVSNLTLATTYRVMAISYNGAYGFESYITTAGTNIGNFTTLTFPLPVQFGNVEAKARNCNVEVSFETFTETDNNHFVIERSRDGNSWDSLAALAGKGTSGTRTQYNYTDHFPQNGQSYYRIKQVDEDHNYKYSKILLVKNDCSSAQMIQVYPNPARDKFQIVLFKADDKAAIFIYNMAGQRMSPAITGYAGKRMVNMAGMPDGSYFLKVISLDKVFTQVITILK